MTKKKKHMSSQIFSVAMAGLVFVSSAMTSFAGSHKNYYLKTTIDYGGFGLLYDVKTDNPSGKSTGTGGEESPYEEEKNGYSYGLVRHYGNIGLNNVPNKGSITQGNQFLKVNFLEKINSKEDEDINKVIESRYGELKKSDKNAPLVFSFPGIKDDKLNATSADYSRASLVGETLVTGLNQAIVFINNNTYTNLTSKNSLKYLLAKLSYTSEFSNERISSYHFEVGESEKGGVNKINISWVKENKKNKEDKDKEYEKAKEELIPVNGLDYEDYVKVEVVGGPNGTVHSYFPWRMAKGYKPNQALFDSLNNSIQSKIISSKEVAFDENEFLTWGQLILQAMVNYDTSGTSEQDYASDLQTIIGQGLGSDLSRSISSVRNILGLASMSELILNMGARPTNYHLGVMTKDMRNIALTVYTLNLIISLLFVGFMLIKMIHQKMLATTNVIAKTSLMEGIKDLIFVSVMLGFFAPLFEMLLELNYLIVRTFSYSSDYMSAFTAMGNTALSMESMAGFIVSTMFLSIDMYINFVYLIREITVSFLFAVAPIIIVSYLWSPAQKNLVFGYFRELVGNIFMQSFHAITMTFFSAYNSTNMTSLQALASAYCFIPITQLFRQLVLGNSGGFSEKIGGKLAGQVATMTTGMKNSAIKANQTKTLVDAQNKAQLEMATASSKGNIWSTAGATLSGIGASVATGTITGAVAGSVTGPGAVATALGGAGLGLIAGVGGALKGQDVTKDGTTKALGELGSVQKEMATQNIGMGLAEMGIGLGVSSYDGAGDRMVQSGLANVQQGALMRGRADSLLGKGGEYMAETAGNEAYYNGVSRSINSTVMAVGYGMSNVASNSVDKSNFMKNTTNINEIENKDHIDAVVKCEHVGKFTMNKDMSKAMAHTNIGAKEFDNGTAPINSSSQGTDGQMYEAIKAFRNNDYEKMREIKNTTAIKDVIENEITGCLDIAFDTAKTGFRAMEGVNMHNGVIEPQDVRIDNIGGYRGL